MPVFDLFSNSFIHKITPNKKGGFYPALHKENNEP